ncbi:MULTISPECIES: TetR/AcrR family transcriptional regulator [unclassified Cryobacterium]|uniref:TetR/AcrR family transcriptional regulator n=1 Tax=unclassified Cryobacterium TaxID=2649013 RepID=UPI002AB5B26F|nr:MULTISPECIES: TetR/AcrR family transcriptional regulator [unclassified Cryobacterium]MDY7528409.1 TetR/AcrR family transcriptional regulator [Cryobacterium sp. 10C2]MDY7540829.1 TetR/AcrR family transcriptional regulator [Cryobacterium sp. 5B3]MDY7555844.1 TetR/AcrR family transcriptional regulator [Cryobacterium sp. 10C3]MEB0000227.1 TetR/AcrR family transcriptional regulator [Cryobacterium sp. RTS3]MEB0202739.1 TetR/AcrR family transcriptional regulator [Cryobacterium sp. 5I3]
MNSERNYSMTNRSISVAKTRARILRAVLELATEKLTVEIVLADVSHRSGVTVQTILRHFGSRAGLFDAAVEFGSAEVVAERATPVGDVTEAVRVIIDHYETRGDWVIALLGQEGSDERIRGITMPGKQLHRDWVETVFGLRLAKQASPEHSAITDLLVVATDVYTWKLLRRDRGLSRELTEQRMQQLVDAILASPRE